MPFSQSSKRILFASLLLLQAGAVFQPIPARADINYWPVQIFDGGLAQRPDLSGRSEQLITPLSPHRGVNDDEISMRHYGAVGIGIFSEVSRFIQALAENRHVDIPLTSSLQAPGCPQNAGFNVDQLPKGKTDFLCKVRIARYELARQQGWENACAEAEVPEAYVMRRPPGQVSITDLDSLEGLIGTAGEPLSRIDLPPALRGPSVIAEMRIILRKVRLGTLRDKLRARQTQLEALVDGLKNVNSCIKGDGGQINEQLQRARAVREENTQMLSYLDQLESEGRAIAAGDLARVQANGRVRTDMTLEWMTDRERELLSMALGGLFWRMRGGGLVDEPQGTQLTRVYFTQMPMSVLARLAGGRGREGLGTDIFLRLFEPWGEYMDMGTDPNQQDEFFDLLGMSDRGLNQVSLAMQNLQNSGYTNEALRAGGLMMGPCYYASVKDLRHLLVSPQAPLPYREFIDGFTAWGEVCSGATISLGLAKSLLAGRTP